MRVAHHCCGLRGVLWDGRRDKTAQWRAYDSSECLTFYGQLDETHSIGGLVLKFR
jgi:hypothetical protein